MLINCPKCGFQQPQDKYCAHCGVDIESFRPAAPPLMQRFFSNPFIPLSLLILLVSAIGFFLHKNNQDNFQNRVSYLKSTVQIENNSNTPRELHDEVIMDAHGEDISQQSESAPPVSTTEAASLATENENPQATTKSLGPGHLKVYYAEVGRATLSDFIGSSRNTSQYLSFNDYSAGILPAINKAIGASTVKILHTEDHPLTEGKSIQWFLGWTDKRDPSRQIGLNTYFELNDADSTNLRGNIEILRTWKEETAPGVFEVQKRTFPAIFEIGGGNGFFMWGVLPRRSNLANEDELVGVDLFKILRSPQFRSQESEFVIFVEFDRNN